MFALRKSAYGNKHKVVNKNHHAFPRTQETLRIVSFVVPILVFQPCQTHAKANACRRVRKAHRKQFSKDLNKVFYAPRYYAICFRGCAFARQAPWPTPTGSLLRADWKAIHLPSGLMTGFEALYPS